MTRRRDRAFKKRSMGTLLNTARAPVTQCEPKPYLVTAHHCVGNDAHARTLEATWFYHSASDLEAGDADAFVDSLGDGAGKWRLTVRASARVQVASLLQSATGAVGNASR